MENFSEIERANKAVVGRFNREFIEQGSEASFNELVAPEFVNRSAAPGMPSGPEGLLQMFNHVLRPALAELSVEICDQIAEGDKVTTRKIIRGVHRGVLFGIPPTNQQVTIDVIDIVRVERGRYAEHWGINTLPSVLQRLRGQ
jgi:predicted ester cyclase